MDNIKEIGRLIYIEPTNINFDGQQPTIEKSSTKIFSPLENFCIAVDLIVRLKERQACGIGDKTNGNMKELVFTTGDRTLSFFQGSKSENGEGNGYLTTNYTDVNLIDPLSNTEECIGIESINIEYESWQYPIVTIKFIDVRGASVFSQAEYHLDSNGAQNASDEGRGNVLLYRSLFSFPYPLFILKVKGFYGMGATFYLTIEDVNLSFDSTSGNFEITSKFIGMMYRIYTDLPMIYIAVAPYTEVGGAHWRTMVSDGEFQFRDKSGVKKGEMLMFPELAAKIAKLQFDQNVTSLKEEQDKYTEETDGRIAQLERFKSPIVIDSYLSTNDGGKTYLVVLSKEKYDDKELGVKTVINDYFKQVGDYDKTYKTNFSSVFPNELFNGDIKTTAEVTYTRDKNGNVKETVKKPNNSKRNDYISERINGIIGKKVANDTTMNAYIIPCASDYETTMKSKVNTEMSVIMKEKNDKMDEYKKKSEELTETLLGFKPSIKNMYDLAFAHMDTFIYVFNETLKQIQADMDGGKRSNTFTQLDENGGNGNFSDIPDYIADIPPFPALYGTETKDFNGSKTNVRVEKWLEDEEFEMFRNFPEISLVNDLLNAAVLYTEEIQMVEKYMEEMTAIANGSGETSGQTTITLPTSLSNFIPTTNYDFNNRGSSPYSFLSELYKKNNETAISASLFMFLNRAFYFLLHNPDNTGSIESFGLLEAYNFQRGVGKPNSDQINQFIKELGNINILDIATKQASKDDAYTCYWTKQGFGQHAEDSMMDYTNDKSELRYRLRGTYGAYRPIPIGLFSQPNLKANMFLGQDEISLAKSSEVLLTSNLDSEYSRNPGTHIGLSGNTFIIDPYIPHAFDSIKKNVLLQIDSEDKFGDLSTKAKFLYDNESGSYYWFDNPLHISKSNKIECNVPSHTFMNASSDQCITYETAINDIDNAYVYHIPLNIISTGSTRFNNTLYRLAHDILGITDDEFKKIPLKITTGRYPNIFILIAGFMYKGQSFQYNNETKRFTINEKHNHPKQNAIMKYYSDWYAANKSLFESFINNYQKDTISDTSGYGDGFAHPKTDDNGEYKKNYIQKFLKKVLLETVSIIDYCNGIHFFSTDNKYYNEDGTYTFPYKSSIKSSDLTLTFESFKNGLTKLYDGFNPQETQELSSDISREMKSQFENRDIKLSTYITLKTLYDKWLCDPYKGHDTWNYASDKSDFKSFMYIDTLYNNIGLDVTVNLTSLNEWLSQCIPSSNIESTEGEAHYNNTSVYQYLSRIAEETGGMLMALPQAMGGMNQETMAQMFKPMTYFSDWDRDSSTFVYIYHYKPSEHTGAGQYANDGFDLVDYKNNDFDFTEEAKSLLTYGNEYKIPSFGVTFAKQNQSIFNNITLNTQNAAVTEASIMATGYIAAKASSLPKSTTLFGQDLYRVRTSYSYQCEFDMLGNMQVMPLMYFQLNNIPFWKGAYMIYKVSHIITPGDMKTHISGFRINKYSLPFTDGSVITTKKSYGSSLAKSGGVYVADDKWIIPTGDQIDNTHTFDSSNVSETNPVICLIPAHGPNVRGRTAEWLWSYTVVEILETLLNATTYNGKKLNVQMCNKDGAYTNDRTSEMTQVESIIQQFGSEKVIAFTPHCGNSSKNTATVYYGGIDANKQDHEYESSKLFASIMMENMKSFIQDKGKHKQATPGMFMTNTKNPECIKLKKTEKDVLNELTICCPTIAPEFWCDGYPSSESCKKALTRTALQEKGAPYTEKSGDTYKLSQGWLMSEEGLNAIAQLAYDGIIAFISTLPYSKDNDWTIED